MYGEHGDFVARIAHTLGGAKKTSNGYDCRCPCHDDKTASLSLAVGDDRALVWRCHAGCSQEDVRDYLQSHGLVPERQQTTGPRHIVATYDYTDERGQLVFQVVRFQPKDFRQRRRPRGSDAEVDIRDGWVWSVKGIRSVIYRLPGALAAIAADLPVIVVEGEKAVDALVELGLPATCSPGGAGKWRPVHANLLSGADVVVIPDNDEPGRKHAESVAHSLAGMAKRTRILTLPDLPEKGDVYDWLKAGGTSTALWDLAEKAPNYIPPEAATGKVKAGPWQKALLKTNRGDPKPLLANASLALREAPEWKGVLALNQLRMVIELASPPPWAHRNGSWKVRTWTDNDDVRATEWLQRAGIEVGHTTTHAAVAEVAENNAYHPVRDYLNSLKWDGIERNQHFATDILGADDTPFVQAASSAMLIAAVARAMVPGCKVDNVPILEGPQGAMKSTAVRTLFGAEWFTDELAELGSKDASMQVATTWCAEISDLSGMTKAESERIKAFASRRVDRFRPPFGRALIERPRQAVMWGTTNDAEWGKDPTGARRFWPIACGRIDIKRLATERDQLWAEATHWWRKGEPWWLTDSATVELAREAQEARRVVDAWDDRIEDYVRGKDDVSVGEVLQHALLISPDNWRQPDQSRVARYLRANGWKRRRPGSKGHQKWRYFRTEAGISQPELGYSE